ncbi:hypothetical protein P7C70_g5985, partial [Phenoliferia sp. Uapishka_3]
MMRESTPETPMTSFIVDAEICAIDLTGAVRPFQELSHRAKKDVELGAVKIRVGVFVFDLMLLNGVSVLAKPFRARRELLQKYFGCLEPEDDRSAKWDLIPSCEDNEPDEVQAFYRKCVEGKAEGIMVKVIPPARRLFDSRTLTQNVLQLLDEVEIDSDDEEGEGTSPSKAKPKGRRKVLPSTYEPDKRGDSWLKVKKDYMDTVGDSLDLIPIGAWHGNGRKAAWWSPILLDFTLSPVYPAAQGLVSERGISLRFPRFIKIREDKTPEEATNAQQLADMYENQGQYRELKKDVVGSDKDEEGGESDAGDVGSDG